MDREMLISLLVDRAKHKIRFSLSEEAVEEGEHYGYPRCCVIFFADQQERLATINERRTEALGDYYKLFMALAWVPCEKCYSALKRNYKNAENMYDVYSKDPKTVQ